MRREHLIDILMPLNEKEQIYKNNVEKAQIKYDDFENRGRKIVIGNQINGGLLPYSHAVILDNIYFNRQNRYSIVPVHKHDFVEINFVYSGTCTAIVNGKKYRLQAGDVCVLDQNVEHTIEPLRDEDVVLNALIQKKAFNHHMIEALENSGVIAGFVAKAISDSSAHDSFLLLHTQSIPTIRENFENILCEFLEPSIGSETLIQNYLTNFLTLLARCYQENKEEECRKQGSSYLTTILRYIEDNCVQCTLEKTAREFGFHPNAFSRYIKKETGRTFKSLVNESRLRLAAFLLSHSNDSISDVAMQCGWSNVRQFYAKFKEAYHKMPKEYRDQHK